MTRSAWRASRPSVSDIPTRRSSPAWLLRLSLVALALAFPLAGLAQEQPKEKQKKEGTAELQVTGCLKGKKLTVTGNPNEEGAVVRGPYVVGRSFQLTGPKDVMAEVKRHDGHLVEVAGLVRSSDVAGAPGVKVGNTRVTVGLGTSGFDPNRSGSQRDPFSNLVVMDATAVRLVSEACPTEKK